MPESSPSVLIIRLDAVGDALALAPLLAALHRDAIPVDLLMSRANAGAFTLDAAHLILTTSVAPRSGTPENLEAIAREGRALAQRGYTHALVATEDPAGYRLARASNARARIGFSNGWGKPFKTLWVRRFLTETRYRSAGLDPDAPHECEVLFRLGRGIVSEPAPTRDPARLGPLVVDGWPLRRDDAIALQVTDKWRRLGIALDDVAAAARAIGTAGRVRAIGARAEAAYALEAGRALGIEVELFDELAPWKRAIAGSRALLTPDSGALHVASMTATPVVAVFPPSPEFALQTARWAPWAAPYRIVRAESGWPAEAAAALHALLA